MSRTKTVSITGTGGHTRVVIPTGYAPTVTIDLAGAGGGAGARYYGSNGPGGNGARITGTLVLNPGDILDVYIGDGGKTGNANGGFGAGGAGGGSALIGSISGQTTVYPVTLSYAWSQFMNDYAVWVNPDGVNPVNATSTITRYIDVTTAGVYQFQAECDNWLNLYIDGVNIINTSNFNNYYATANTYYLGPGRHTIEMAVSNWGGPAGVAVAVYDPYGTQIWNTRSVLDPNTFSYSFRGGSGGNSYGDAGWYVYPGPGGGGGASVVYLNGNLILVSGGGGGGGAEGGHGAGGTAGGDGGIPGRVGGSPYGGQGQPGGDGYDIGGTPGGGGGYNGGNAGNFVYYDDAPSLGANGGTNYNALNVVYTSGSGVYTVPSGVTQLIVSLVGGGGGGGGCTGNEEPLYVGGGGGGGAVTNSVINVTPGQQLYWAVGGGGAGGGVGSYGNAGGTTVLGSTTADGGAGGTLGVYVDDGGDGWNQAGNPGGYPNGGQGGSYSEDGEYGTAGASGGNGSVTIQIGNWSYSTYADSGTYYNGLSGFCNITFTELGSGKVKVAGQWKQITGNWVKVAGQWKQIANAYTKVNGEWKVVSGGVPVPTTFSGDSYG